VPQLRGHHHVVLGHVLAAQGAGQPADRVGLAALCDKALNGVIALELLAILGRPMDMDRLERGLGRRRNGRAA
jgi:hypothetical protein